MLMKLVHSSMYNKSIAGVHYWTTGQRAMISGHDKAFFVVSRDAQSQNIYVVCEVYSYSGFMV